MSIRLIWFIGEPVVVHDFSTDETFEWECREHIETEAEAGDLDHDVALRGEVIEDVALCEVAEGEEAC